MEKNVIRFMNGRIRLPKNTAKEEDKFIDGEWEVAVYFSEGDVPQIPRAYLIGYAQRIK